MHTHTDTRTGSDVFGAGGDEVDEACAAVELGEEDGGVALRVGAADPLQARPDGAVVAAPLPKHAAPIAAHPHPESFNTVRCSIASSRQPTGPHRVTGAGRVNGRNEEGDEQRPEWCGVLVCA